MQSLIRFLLTSFVEMTFRLSLLCWSKALESNVILRGPFGISCHQNVISSTLSVISSEARNLVVFTAPRIFLISFKP